MSSLDPDCDFKFLMGYPRWLNAICFGIPLLGAGAVCLFMLKRRQSCPCCRCRVCACGSAEDCIMVDDPRYLIPKICQEFHQKRWMTGSGGAISIKQGNEIFVSPSGILKERVQADTLFVCDIEGNHIDGPHESKKLKKSSCAPMFMNAYQKRGAGAVFHIHSQNAVMVTMLFPGKEFRITHQQMLKAIVNCKTGRNYRYDEELVIPIVENENDELDIKDSIVAAMEQYPETSAVLVRHHGIYLWGETWVKTKIMCEAYDYIFETVVRMFSSGLDPCKIAEK